MTQSLTQRARALHHEIDDILAAGLDNDALRSAVEDLASRPGFHDVSYRLVRHLLQRDHVRFGPVVRPHLRTYGFNEKGRWVPVWKEAPWRHDLRWVIEHAEHHGDNALFQAAMGVYLGTKRWDQRDEHFAEELLARLDASTTDADMALVLERFAGLHARLNDGAAVRVYRLTGDRGKAFLRRHVPRRRGHGSDDDLVPGLLEVVRPRDESFYYELYRRTSSVATWRAAVRGVLKGASDDDLVPWLERLHLQGYLATVADVFAEVLEERGDVALPYVMEHIWQVLRGGWFRRTGYQRLLRLCRKRGYDALWAAVVRHGATQEDYNKAVLRLVAAGPEGRPQLLRLAGIGREITVGPWGIARVQPLSDAAACALFGADPTLLEGPFKPNLFAGWHAAYPELVAKLLEADHVRLLDYVASRLVTRFGTWVARDVLPVAQTLSEYYEALLDDPTRFAERSANVLGQVPPFTIFSYDRLLEGNRLARLLYEHSAESYLASQTAIRDLLEASEIHAQRVAFAALALDDDRARAAGAAHLDLLRSTLLRPLHRRTRLVAFRALQNAAGDLDVATVVLDAAREALHLPDRRYPKEELVSLIGHVLARHGSLRSAREQPVVYRRAP